MIQGPSDYSGSISTATFNGESLDGDFNLIPGRGYRVYIQNSGTFMWSSEIIIENICTNTEALNYYVFCDTELYEGVECFGDSDCCIGDGLAFDIDDVRFCPDESALNYNPELDAYP